MISAFLIAVTGFILPSEMADVVEYRFLQEVQDTVTVVADSTDAVNQEEELEQVSVWPILDKPGFETADTDSTLRWYMNLDWADRLYLDPGTITYRTGSLGRATGMDIYSYENRHQRLQLYDIPVTDPVTGQVFWGRIPIHKVRSIETADYGAIYEASVHLREHYLVEPRTYLNFDEGKGNYRSLEFSFTHNITPRTNIELSYWDRKDGTLYNNNSMEGSQVVVKARHHLSETMLLTAGMIGNTIDQDQPFGYSIANLYTFDFNPYLVTPVETSASSSQKMNDYFLQIHQRSGVDETANRMAGVSYQRDEWDLSYSQEATRYDYGRFGVYGWQEIGAGPARIRLSGRADIDMGADGDDISLKQGDWTTLTAEADGSLNLLPALSIDFTSAFSRRNDSKSGFDASGVLTWKAGQLLKIKGHGGVTSSIPDLQALYWDSIQWQGDESLDNESSVHTGLSAELFLSPTLTLGVRADMRRVEQGIFSNAEGQFVNIDPYDNGSASAWVSLDSRRFEGDISFTGQRFMSNSDAAVNQTLDTGGDRIWLKASFYWKNYLFNEAAYIKAGLSGMYTPGEYLSADYIAPLNRWQHGTSERYLPSFYRVDVNISARIRWMMVLVRWENVFDQLDQAGYFETAAYPMPPRRFIFGLRVLFSN